MTDPAQVVAIVEGSTEQTFVKSILAPYLWSSGVVLQAPLLGKPGRKGGNVQFQRASRDIRTHLRQRRDTRVTLMVDYYAIGKDWPGLGESKAVAGPARKAEILNAATFESVRHAEKDHAHRFIPYVSMFEFESLHFSEPEVLARFLGVGADAVADIVRRYGEPEKINDSPDGAPSKRLAGWDPRFKKTTTGIEIARQTGIERMKAACPLFGAWIAELENLGGPGGVRRTRT